MRPTVVATMLSLAPSRALVTPAPPRQLGPLQGETACALGLDFGTSGVRCAVVDGEGNLLHSPTPFAWGERRERRQEAADWAEALWSQLDALPAELRARIARIAVSGTSSSMLLVDADAGFAASDGRGPPRMYDFSVSRQAGASGEAALDLLRAHAPEAHTVRSPTSALAKLLAYACDGEASPDAADGPSAALRPAERLAHQADYVASLLTGGAPVSDWHNALKLGYDVRHRGSMGEI